MVAVIVGDKAVLPGNDLALRLPEAQVNPGPMHEDDWSACALFDVGQIDAVDPDLTRLGWCFGERRHGEATADHNEESDRNPQDSDPAHDRLLSWCQPRASNVTDNPRRRSKAEPLPGSSGS